MSNPFAPSIGHIPPELVGEIFLFYQAAMEADGANPLIAALPLTVVCRRWREIALAEQALWSAAFLGASARESLAALAVSRSGQRPLRVHLAGSRLSYPPPGPRTQPAPAWDALLATRPRWAELSCPPHLLDLLLAPPTQLASLARLTLVDPHKAFLFPSTLDGLRTAPRLRAVTLKGIANTLAAPLPWAQLTDFTADYLAYDGLFRLLALCPSLERLSIMAHKAPVSGLRFTHARLRALDLAAADVSQLACVLARLELPALRTLALRPVDTGAPTCIPDPAQRRIRAFFEVHGPKLRSLALAGVGLYLHVLTAVFRALPDLHNLAIDEVHGWTAADARGLLRRPELLPKLESLTYTFAMQNSLARFVADVVDIVNVRWERPPPPRWAQPSKESQAPKSTVYTTPASPKTPPPPSPSPSPSPASSASTSSALGATPASPSPTGRPITLPSTPVPQRNSLGPTSSVLMAAAAANAAASSSNVSAHEDEDMRSPGSSRDVDDAPLRAPGTRTLTRQTGTVSRGASPAPSSSSLASSIKQPSTPGPTRSVQLSASHTSDAIAGSSHPAATTPSTSHPSSIDDLTPKPSTDGLAPSAPSRPSTSSSNLINPTPSQAGPSTPPKPAGPTPFTGYYPHAPPPSFHSATHPRALRTLCISGQGGLWHDTSRAGGALRALRGAKAAGLDVRVRVGGRVWV